jgi:hypothetical protein
MRPCSASRPSSRRYEFVAQLLVFGAQRLIFGSECLNQVQQLPDQVPSGSVGDRIKVDIGNLQTDDTLRTSMDCDQH